MAKAVADTNSTSNQGGFTTDGAPITGFSSMHDSGTGGKPSLGNFPLFAYTHCANDDVNNCVFPKRSRATPYVNGSVVASPGYFSITLSSGIKVDMTAAAHTSLFRFQFARSNATATASSPLILLDLSDLSDSRQDNGTVSVDAASGRIQGGARFEPSFGAGTYVAYFCADFAGAGVRDAGVFVDSRASADVHDLTISRSINGYPLPGGAFVRFADPGDAPVLARVGLSFMSSERACANAETEIPEFGFEATRDEAVALWREKLSPVVVATEGVERSLLVNFYSGIYRTMVNPQDYTGENPLWESEEPYFDSFYCIWDLFRSQLPFLTILDPEQVARMVRSLIDTYRHTGWLPDCRMSLCKGYTQGGSNADIVLADAHLKNVSSGINWADGLAAVIKDAEDEPFDWCCEGRGGLASWKALGYIPAQDFDPYGFGTHTRSVSRTLEYSYNDFAVATLAQRLGAPSAQVATYLGRAGNWRNLWKADQVSPMAANTSTAQFVGFFQPRYANQTWGFQEPLACSSLDSDASRACSLQNTGQETFESSIWEYGFYVPHDMAALISVLGGPEAFTTRLSHLHDASVGSIANEPAFLPVALYHYAGRPGLSSRQARRYVPGSFKTTWDGLPGNDDSGAMGAFVAFAMMGLFPVPGQDVYLITAPFFASVEVRSPVTGRVAKVRCVGVLPGDGVGGNGTNNGGNGTVNGDLYIQSALLDNEPYTRNWLDHSFFTEGRELVLTLGRNESRTWGTRAEDVPPSLGGLGGAVGMGVGGV
ncbi:glycoside hydrolase family 92 protein [Aplosporella prunicola CBS 121167]|uniref:Glycoside hydrolase family 92 protein n=1 Tax=Aplosporella prunicola CBS 121167 TaxID=1176127 RepID=A0A6A6B5Y1_9PEZI|nr:glycoside hydrolase family 92 protein [Aplosporella prunicola CBS 121167]KAF2139420.1 glycoside hydrolase family 92 protein [Aplosporella prunicola CBS 121167]